MQDGGDGCSAAHEHARRRFLARAEWASNPEVDELLVQAGDRPLGEWLATASPDAAWVQVQ